MTNPELAPRCGCRCFDGHGGPSVIRVVTPCPRESESGRCFFRDHPEHGCRDERKNYVVVISHFARCG